MKEVKRLEAKLKGAKTAGPKLNVKSSAEERIDVELMKSKIKVNEFESKKMVEAQVSKNKQETKNAGTMQRFQAAPWTPSHTSVQPIISYSRSKAKS